MQRFARTVAYLALLSTIASVTPADEPAKPGAADPSPFTAADWPWWRGPNRNGHADPKQKPPLKWSATENVLWQSEVSGRGHGSPIVVGDQVFLATADDRDASQSVLCYDRKSGKQLWQTEVHCGGIVQMGANPKSTLASSTPACDGERVFINFLHDGAIYTTALSRAGKILWQEKVADYVLHQGFGSSPAVYRDLVIVSADNKGEGTGAIVALERATGKRVWKVSRPKAPNYTSPIIINVAGREQLFFTGCDLITSLDPKTGKKLWEVEGSTTETVTSTVTDGTIIVTSGGYPKKYVSAVRADSGALVWENKIQVYVPSMLMKDGYLFAVTDQGIAKCWKSDTGKEVWSGRLEGGFTASPTLVGEHIYATNETGRTFIFKASPAEFNLVADNQLGNEVMATPAICGGRIYMRIAVNQQGRRQEKLVCIGRP